MKIKLNKRFKLFSGIESNSMMMTKNEIFTAVWKLQSKFEMKFPFQFTLEAHFSYFAS